MPADPTFMLSHENRISKLENDHVDSKIDIAKLTERIDSGFDILGEKLDDFKLDLARTTNKVDGLCEQVKSIEKKNAQKQALKDKLWKGFWAVVLVVVGASIKFAFEMLK
jgi:uncharacterized membrane protein